MPERPYQPSSYWQERLSRDFALSGAGYFGLGQPFNEALYRQRRVVLGRALRKLRLKPARANVVELGPGTGFYVRIWRELGVRRLLGVDITQVSVDRLSSEFPDYRFRRADVSERIPYPAASADIVTAFDVLFHITDDARFSAALRNVARTVRPGGAFLVSDLFLHGDPFVGYHQTSRSLDTYMRELDSVGFDVIGRLPVFVTMHPAYDLAEGPLRRLAFEWWRLLERRLTAHPENGRLLGRLLGRIDRAATALLREGPGMELLVARKR